MLLKAPSTGECQRLAKEEVAKLDDIQNQLNDQQATLEAAA